MAWGRSAVLRKMRTQTLVKLGLGVVVLAVLPWLFLRTLENTIAEPYAVDAAAFSSWALVLADPSRPSVAALGLRSPGLLSSLLFDQLFDRTMASMTSPIDDVLPIVLNRELRGEIGTVLSPEELLEIAGAANLEQARLEPVCMAVKREPFAGRTREFYFVLFDIPAVSAFRQELGRLAAERGVMGAFGSLDLVLPIAGSDARFDTWWPLEVDRETDCQAPLGL